MTKVKNANKVANINETKTIVNYTVPKFVHKHLVPTVWQIMKAHMKSAIWNKLKAKV